jgi:hypothetical protein
VRGAAGGEPPHPAAFPPHFAEVVVEGVSPAEGMMVIQARLDAPTAPCPRRGPAAPLPAAGAAGPGRGEIAAATPARGALQAERPAREGDDAMIDALLAWRAGVGLPELRRGVAVEGVEDPSSPTRPLILTHRT